MATKKRVRESNLPLKGFADAEERMVLKSMACGAHINLFQNPQYGTLSSGTLSPIRISVIQRLQRNGFIALRSPGNLHLTAKGRAVAKYEALEGHDPLRPTGGERRYLQWLQ